MAWAEKDDWVNGRERRQNMSKKDKILGDFHNPTSDKHPPESVGNQQIWGNGKQVGSLEYIPDSKQGFRIQVNNPKGKKVTDL